MIITKKKAVDHQNLKNNIIFLDLIAVAMGIRYLFSESRELILLIGGTNSDSFSLKQH
ncbi:MAG: hypothetical protein ACFFAS_05180 [Promethearchaeota archaeon]